MGIHPNGYAAVNLFKKVTKLLYDIVETSVITGTWLILNNLKRDDTVERNLELSGNEEQSPLVVGYG
jgi:exopolysaccharide biosynthesis protein